MPYALQGTTVINSDTGQPVPGGKHPTRAKALAHLRALMANVSDAKQSQFAGETMEDFDDGLDGAAPSPAAVEAARRQFARALGVDTVAQKDYSANVPEAKAANYSAHAGQAIAGHLFRGAGGKFSASSAGGSGAAPKKAPAAAAKPKKPKRAARGGKKPAPKPKAPKKTPEQAAAEHAAARAAEQAANRSAALGKLNIAPDGQQALEDLRAGKQPDAAALARGGMVEAGLVQRAEDGSLHLTSAGRSVLGAADRGDVGAAGDAISQSRDRGAVAARRQGERQAKLAKRKPRRGRSSPPPPSLAGAFGRTKVAVFKDSAGQWRWIAKTTTAFEDRDNEIISTKALEDDTARADGDGQYGPLRWWHIGKPDPLDKAAPWGPGVDLGWADFNAMSGKTLIESGTFTSEPIARAVAAKADELELSPGFFHAANEPDQTGVFTHIRRFERSLVPKWAGRASNRYTGLIVQGKEAMDDKKIQALKDLGIPETTIDALVADVKQTEKAAEADGVRYKEANPVIDFFRSFFAGEQVATKEEELTGGGGVPEMAAPEPEPAAEADPLAILKAEVEALTAQVKAFGKPEEPAKTDEVVVQEDAFGDEPAADALADDGGDAGGVTLSAEDLAAIGQVISAALEPLIGAMGITSKLEGHLGELKTMMGGYTKTKDDAQAAQAEEVAALKASIDQQQAKLAELIGDEPRAGYRASAAKDNVLNPDVLAAIKDNNGNSGADFSDITQQLFPQLNGR